MKEVKQRGAGFMAACLAVCCLAAAPTVRAAERAANGRAAEGYQAHLGPTPVPDGVRSPITGEGSVLAMLNGQTLQIEGQYSGIASTATNAQLMRGAGIGIPGPAMATIALAAGGKINGSVKLNADQLAALRAGHLYVQINSDKSPAPAGHLFGWLLPAHETAGEGEPQLGHWFLPQGAGLKSPPAPRGRS